MKLNLLYNLKTFYRGFFSHELVVVDIGHQLQKTLKLQVTSSEFNAGKLQEIYDFGGSLQKSYS